MRIATAAASFVVVLCSLAAQTREPAPASPSGRLAARPAQFALEAGEHKIGDLVDKAAAFLGRNILFCEQELAACGPSGGSVRLQGKVEVDAAGCEEVLSNLLYVRGLAIVPLDADKNMYEVLAMSGPRAREIASRAVARTPEQVLARPQLRVPVTTNVTLLNINAMIATNALRPFFANNGTGTSASLSLGTAGSINSLILSGFQDQVATALKLVQTADAAAVAEKQTQDERMAALEQRIAALEARLAGDKKDGK